MDINRETGPQGNLSMEVILRKGTIREPMNLAAIRKYAYPQPGLSDEVNDWRSDNTKRPSFLSSVARALSARRMTKMFGNSHAQGALFLKVIRGDGYTLDLGLAGLHIITTAGVTFIADAFRGTVEPEIMKYHGLGTGATAEVIGNTALQTEATTQYNPDNTRATGTLAGSANVFTTVGVNTVDASYSPTEWGLLSQAATGGGTLFDRETFTAVPLASGDSLQTTYNLTFTAGG